MYGLAGGKYYAFDPKARKVIFTGDLPVKAIRWPGLSDEPVGPRGLIYGIGDDAVFALNPADDSAQIIARHESLTRAFGFYVTPDGVLYYGSGANLMRCRVGD
ncbi:MAG: hypothetical protein FJ272_20095 [Planctomycetes bacterium]|nr:hypothetical protein [Planctomycetota bacterium]